MQTQQPVRVPARVIALLAFMILACGSSEEYSEPTYYDPGPSYTPPPTQPEPTFTPQAKPAPASAPTFPSYIAELDRNQPPECAKRVDVSIQRGAPTKPADDLWKVLSDRHGVSVSDNNPNRGNAGDPLIIYDFELGMDDDRVKVAAVAESKIIYNSDGSSRKVAHGLGFCTWDNSRAKMEPKGYYKLNDPYVYALGYFRDGRMHGPWAFNTREESRQGTPIMSYIGEYRDNHANGEVRFFDKDGYLQEQCWVTAGVRHGTSYRWTTEGSSQSTFVGNVQSGLRSEWNAKGELTRRGQIYDTKFYGKTEFWYPGSTNSYITRYFKPDGNYGWAAYYHKDGYLNYQAWIQDGDQTGPYLSYTPEGQKLWKGERVKGNAHGHYVRYHADGWIDMECEYVNGAQTGLLRWMYQSGKVNEEGNVTAGVRDGEFKKYREDGSLEWVANWDAGSLGKTTYYDAAGKVERVEGDPEADRAATGWTWIDNGEFRSEEIFGSALAFDPATGKCILFGGDDMVESIAPMLEFDGTKWNKVQPRRLPPARTHGYLYWDAALKRMRLAGGYAYFDFDDSDAEPQKDVWEWDGKIWTLVDDGEGGPSRIFSGKAAYDPQRNSLVVLAPVEGGDTPDWQTFLFDGKDWVRKPGPKTSNGTAAQLVWDPSAGKVAVWLPSEPTGAASHRAWHWDGEQWQQGPATLVPPDGHVESACADEARKGIWAIGINGLMFYDGTQWAAYETPVMVGAASKVLVDPKTGRVFVHGCMNDDFGPSNESWWFDPEKGKRK